MTVLSATCARVGRPSLRLQAWPPSHQLAWAAALTPGDILEGQGGLAAAWAVATRNMAVAGYGRWLSWMEGSGELDRQALPGAQMTHEVLQRYLAELRQTVAPFTVATQLQQLGNAMRAMAPQGDWRWIQRASDRIRVTAKSVRNKRAALQLPATIVALGFQLMAGADAATETFVAERAVAFRDGLMIALLAYLPMRRRNLAAIRCDEELVKRGDAWRLVFPAAETKAKRLLELSIPAELTAGLERYLRVYRPVLLAKGRIKAVPVTGLWVSRQGTQMGGSAIWHQIRDRTKAAFGVALNPHLFRDCAATEIAISAPEQVGMIQGVLGHTSLATAERHYNQAGSIEAGRRVAQTITGLRGEGDGTPPGK